MAKDGKLPILQGPSNYRIWASVFKFKLLEEGIWDIYPSISRSQEIPMHERGAHISSLITRMLAAATPERDLWEDLQTVLLLDSVPDAYEMRRQFILAKGDVRFDDALQMLAQEEASQNAADAAATATAAATAAADTAPVDFSQSSAMRLAHRPILPLRRTPSSSTAMSASYSRGRQASRQRQSNQRQKGPVTCYFCDKKGHMAGECEAKKEWKRDQQRRRKRPERLNMAR
ncbi:MAG: hypothetical protein Q9187_008590 [Circinaria calcarea]